MNQRQLVPLGQLAPGLHAIVREIRGGVDFSGRLAAVGLTKESRIEMLHNTGRGPVLVRVHETRLALGRGEALKILAEEINDELSA